MSARKKELLGDALASCLCMIVGGWMFGTSLDVSLPYAVRWGCGLPGAVIGVLGVVGTVGFMLEFVVEKE